MGVAAGIHWVGAGMLGCGWAGAALGAAGDRLVGVVVVGMVGYTSRPEHPLAGWGGGGSQVVVVLFVAGTW